MVVTLIIFLAIIVFLAFFVGKNLLNVCTIWFFKNYVDISVAMLVFIAFGAGIVFSLLLLFFSKMKKAFAKDEEEDVKITEKKSHKLQKAENKAKAAKEKKLAKISNINKKWSTNKEGNETDSEILSESVPETNPTE